ncbi:recombinase family protein [Acetobacter pasteurianus]
MTRVVYYARYSTDKQSASSIEDQFRLCEAHAMREKWAVVGSYHDAAISGSGMTLRPGIQALLRDAQAGAFDAEISQKGCTSG